MKNIFENFFSHLESKSSKLKVEICERFECVEVGKRFKDGYLKVAHLGSLVVNIGIGEMVKLWIELWIGPLILIGPLLRIRVMSLLWRKLWGRVIIVCSFRIIR